MIRIMFLMALCLMVLSVQATSYFPKEIAVMNVNKPGFATLVPNLDSSDHHLIITSFSGIPYTTDNVYYTPNISSLDFTRAVTLKNKGLVWPNEATYYTGSLFGKQIDPFGGIMVPFGFLVPSKGNGGLYYYPFARSDRSVVTNQEPINVSRKSPDGIEWFYHRAKFVDLSGNGITDILTCRTYKPAFFGSTETQLVAFIHNKETNEFDEQVLMDSACDVFFDWADIDKDGRNEIVSAGFFISQLNIIYSEDPNNNFLNLPMNKLRTIDASAGQLFEVKVADLDNDGNLELLATNHQGNKAAVKGSIFYYRLTGDIKTGSWAKTIIYDDFPVLNGGFNQAAPGAAKLFHPNVNEKGRSHIILAGDGSQYAYYFEPSATGELSYTMKWRFRFFDTIGEIAVGDINGDGFTEAFIPIYEKNACHVYSFKP